MPVINGVYLKDFAALPGSVADANIIPIAIAGNQIAYRTTVAGIITDARITGKLLTGLSVTGTTISATDSILTAFGKVQNQINNRVSSVGLTMPSAFNVANSPITNSGILEVTAIGSASQYIRGDGQLATLPTSGGGGGGASFSYYLNGSVNASVAGYKQMSNSAIIGTGTDFTLTGDGLIAQFLTDVANPNRLLIPGGAWNFEMYFQVSSVGGNSKFYVELLKYNGSTFTTIASSSAVPEEITNGTTIDLYLTSIAVPETVLLATDRLAIRVYIVDNAAGRTVTLHTEDNTLCEIITTFIQGISELNGLTANNQFFATGTSGTDFAISSVTDTHTFNLPDASATARGVITTSTQTIAGAKTFTGALSGTSATFSGNVTSGNETNSENLFIANGLTYSGLKLQRNSVNKWAIFNNNAGTDFFDIYNYGTSSSALSITFGNNVLIGTTTDAGYKLDVNGTGRFSDALTGTSATFSSTVTASSLIKSGGTSSQFLKADGSIDGTAYGTGSVTSVAALTLGTSGTDLSSSVANGTTTPVITLNIPTASAANRGVLSSADWTTFNAKQAALSGTGIVKSTAGVISYLTDPLPIANGGTGSAIKNFVDLTTTQTIAGLKTFTSSIYISGGNALQLESGTSGNSATLWIPPGLGSSILINLPSTGGTLALTSALDSYLPLAGGTLTGALSGTSATFSGNLGIGTTSPDVAVEIRNTNGLLTALRLKSNAGGTNVWATMQANENTQVFNFGTDTAHPISFRTASDERMRLTSAGRLLIGTATESTFLLDVNGTGRFSGELTGTSATFSSLAGTGTRMVVSDSTGLLSTQAIPGGGGGGSVDELQVALLSQVFG